MDIKFLTILLLAINAVQVFGTCDPTRCASIPAHYDELGCKPIIKEGECCPNSFDCKHLDSRNENKCYFKGKIFDADTKIDSDLLIGSCIGAVHCKTQGKVIYAHKDCLEFFGPPLQANCTRQYSNDKCCSIGTVCGEEATKLKTCEFEGKIYKEGERMYPETEKCYKCLCTADFDSSKNIRENQNCVKVSCNMELLEIDNIRNKCVPIYHEDVCCPYNWRCPAKNDGIIPGNQESTGGAKCKFGNLEFNIGDTLSSGENNCSKCTCNIPPMLTCKFTPDC